MNLAFGPKPFVFPVPGALPQATVMIWSSAKAGHIQKFATSKGGPQGSQNSPCLAPGYDVQRFQRCLCKHGLVNNNEAVSPPAGTVSYSWIR